MRFDSVHLRPHRQIEFTSIFDEMTGFETEQRKSGAGDNRVLFIEHGDRLKNRLRSKSFDGKIAI
ncbi:hypothetical protein [Collimonas pratensis]|uniref:Uncharacterized protein n=1 Tax=Collimonas pratensis TaxID=279113 RepID=A0A127QAH3_9BURK|nr:hypothetical protein [Collimonas pratensis]AMP06986.1 hypothetical protein CPter91_4687 [Collimonas pratensis]